MILIAVDAEAFTNNEPMRGVIILNLERTKKFQLI